MCESHLMGFEGCYLGRRYKFNGKRVINAEITQTTGINNISDEVE